MAIAGSATKNNTTANKKGPTDFNSFIALTSFLDRQSLLSNNKNVMIHYKPVQKQD
jgi:hypothetical protein